MQLKIAISVFFIVLPMLGFCNDSSSVIWKSTYYGSIPKQKSVSSTYCEQHEPGTFIGIVNDELLHGAITNRHIKLSQFTFKQYLKDGVYFMQGTLLASGISGGEKWQEPMKYYVYKLTQNGVTRGVWSSRKCKGLYIGEVVRK